MGVLGIFRRVDETPFKVLEQGKVRTLQKGERALLEFDIYKDVWGFRFEGFFRKQVPYKNLKVQVEEVTQEENKNEPQEKIMEVEVQEVREETKKDIDLELIKMLKKLTKKDFFVMKKDTCKEYLERLDIDYSRIKDDKWSLVKFLQGIIKEL